MSDLPPGFLDDDAPPGFGADDAGVATATAEQQRQEAVAAKCRDWIRHNNRRYKQRAAFNAATRAATAADRLVGADFLRKAVKDHGDLSDPKFAELKRVYIGQLRFLPIAIFKLLENLPMPWEAAKYVDVLYHVSGALTVVDESPMVCEPVFVAQWATAWNAMRKYKQENTPFPALTELTLPEFAEAWVLDLDPKPPVRLDMEGAADLAHIELWFYDSSERPEPDVGHVDPKKSNRWSLASHTLATLQRLGAPLCADHAADENYFYLWNQHDFRNAKILGITLPGAPRFRHHPIHKKVGGGAANPMPSAGGDNSDDDAAGAEDITDFNDPAKRIVRGKMLKEVQLAFPFLYGLNRVEHALVTNYHRPHDPEITDVTQLYPD